MPGVATAVAEQSVVSGGRPVENPYRLKDHYRMSSERISVDPASLRTAADGNAAAASQLDDYSRACKQWIADVEQEFLRCHGPVAAPVGTAMRAFFDGVGDQATGASGEHSAMGDNLTNAAGRYEDADHAGATAVNAAAGGAL